MPPGGNYNGYGSGTPIMVPAMPAAAAAAGGGGTTYYGTETVVIDAEASPLVVVHDEQQQRLAANADASTSSASMAPTCRDLPFAILFGLHAVAMACLGMFAAPQGYKRIKIDMTLIEDEIRKGDDTTEEDVQNFEQFVADAAAYMQIYPLRIVTHIVIPSCLLAYVLGAVSTAFCIKPFPRLAVYTCLVCSVVWVAIVMLWTAIASGSTLVYLLTGLAVAASMYYVSIAWKMVPFAAINLKMALQGMGHNSGVYLVAFFFAELGFCWVLYWLYVVVGKTKTGLRTFLYVCMTRVTTSERGFGLTLFLSAQTGTSALANSECRLAHPDSDFDINSDKYDKVCDPPPLVGLAFLLSLYWTNTVIMVCAAQCCMLSSCSSNATLLLIITLCWKEYRASHS